MPRYALSQPHFCSFTGPCGQIFRGPYQLWYPDPWQRRAGCGPTTASLCLSYLAQTQTCLQDLSPKLPQTVENFLPFMEEVWRFVTPTHRGLDNLEGFGGGAQQFAKNRHCRLSWSALPIPGCEQEENPSPAVCANFLRTALTQDLPVAFLNFSNGDLSNLDDWHWVPLVWLEESRDQLTCGILDQGKELTIDFSRWLCTSVQGGGLIFLHSY